MKDNQYPKTVAIHNKNGQGLLLSGNVGKEKRACSRNPQ